MRQVLVLLAVAALAAGAAEAAFGSARVSLRTPGAEYIQLQNGNGRAAVMRRGALNVDIDRGRLRVVDLGGPGRPRLSPTCQRRAHRVSARTVEIRGRNVRCLISSQDGGKWQAIMLGRGISASGRVAGSLTLDAYDRGPTGMYRIGDQDWRRWPRSADTFGLNRR